MRNRYLLLLDASLLLLAPFLLFALEFEGWRWPLGYATTARDFAVAGGLAQLAIYVGFGLYRRFWRFASAGELKLVFTAGALAALINVLLGRFVLPLLAEPRHQVPASVLFSYALLSVAMIAIPRLYIRMRELSKRRRPPLATDRRVLIVGAGAAGHMMARELFSHATLELCPVGFVDDNPRIHGLQLESLPVFGSLDSIPDVVESQGINEIVIAVPGASGTLVRKIVGLATSAGVGARTIPGIGDLLSGKIDITQLRTIQIEDLLRREPIRTDMAKVTSLAVGGTVMVTGAGGSIGSELCRQLAALAPARIVLVGRGENSIFDIQNELRRTHGAVELASVIADVRDRDLMATVFDRYRPRSVFHAAAHKHVPLMEANPAAAVTNNVIGTRNVVELSLEHGVEHFVLVSTDKAVRPTNVMGATKRVAEHVVRQAALNAKGSYVSVRFGNVLGSRGSVVPMFERQIKAGGPVTITHPEMRRFFMTIPEAVQLILQAGAMGQNGDLFMLDMGEPVKVVDLAADMIRLYGLEVGTDIAIEFVGSRPGEKLYEEMFWGDEVAEQTEHPKVLRARNNGLAENYGEVIDHLCEAGRRNAGEQRLRELLRAIVPDFATMEEPIAVGSTPLADSVIRRSGVRQGSSARTTETARGRPSNPSAVVLR